MTTAQPKVTVVVAVYNAVHTLQRCIDSVLAQTYPHTELVLMDGSSTDGSARIVLDHVDRVHYAESSPDRGIYHAWNKALQHATGDWICFLGADDILWDSGVLEQLAPVLERTRADFVYGTVAIVSKSGETIRTEGVPWSEARVRFTNQMSIPHPGLLHRATLFQTHGVFDDTFRIVGDWDLLLRHLPQGEAEFVPNLVTVGFQHGGISNSPAAMRGMLAELARVRKNHGLRNSWRDLSMVRIKMTVCAIIVTCFGETAFRLLADLLRRMTGRRAVWE